MFAAMISNKMHSFALFVLLPTVLASTTPTNLIQQRLEISNDYLLTTIGIGEPAQNFDLALELDSSRLIVLDKTSNDNALDFQYDYVKSLYDPIGSNTAQLTNYACRYQYSNGQNATGVYVNDILTLTNKTFKESSIRFCDINTARNATRINQDPLKWLMKLPVDGFVGLAQDGIFEKLGYPQVTISLNRNSTNDEEAGQLTLGGEDSLNCKKFQKFPSFDANLWRILANNLTYSSSNIDGSFSLKVNLHSDQLVVPQSIYNAILKSFGGRFYASCDKYKNQPSLQFQVYGTTYFLPIADYFQPSQNDPSTCYLKIDQSYPDSDDQIEFGRNFLKRHCLFLNYNTMDMGLAVAA